MRLMKRVQSPLAGRISSFFGLAVLAINLRPGLVKYGILAERK